MLVRAKAKAEAIQLLAAALAQQVREGSLGQPKLWCQHREVIPKLGWHLASSPIPPGILAKNFADTWGRLGVQARMRSWWCPAEPPSC